MQNKVPFLVGAVIVLALLAFMTTYSVRFTESAVVTTFGKAEASSVRTDPGLYFKLPYPVQSVTKYDTRPRYVETKPETQSTSDNRPLVLQAYMTWRVTDPLKFFQLYSGAGARNEDHYRQAEDKLRSQLRAALSETSRYRVDELLSTGEGGGKLPELEQRILARLNDDLKGAFSDSGAEPLTVGVHSIELPQAVTRQVFDRMKQTRETLASEALNKGNALAESIKKQAEADSRKILDFAERRAEYIRSQGVREAAPFYERQRENPELAVFLRRLQFIREAMTSRGVTLILPMSQPGFELMNPQVAEKLQRGVIPSMGNPTAPQGVPSVAESPEAPLKKEAR